MLYGELREPSYRGGKAVGSLRRYAEHEVAGDIAEARICRIEDCACGSLGGVTAPEEPELRVRHRLHAHGQPVYARISQSRELIGRERIGIGFNSDLRIRVERESAAYLRDDSSELLRGQQRGRTSAEVDGVHRAGLVRIVPYIAQYRLNVKLRLHLGVADGVKVAVSAFFTAEGYMDVDTERAHSTGSILIAGSSLKQNAFTRRGTMNFSSISPMLMRSS